MNDELSMYLGQAEADDTPADRVAGLLNDDGLARLRAHVVAELNKT